MFIGKDSILSASAGIFVELEIDKQTSFLNIDGFLLLFWAFGPTESGTRSLFWLSPTGIEIGLRGYEENMANDKRRYLRIGLNCDLFLVLGIVNLLSVECFVHSLMRDKNSFSNRLF